MSRIYRDAHGVPHVRAGSVAELAHAQGEVTARDRPWQLEWQRRRATGTTAAVFGRPALAWDELARRTRIAAGARTAYDALDPATASFVTAYVEGVNAGLASVERTSVPELDRCGIDPAPWEPWTPLAVFSVQHLLFANLQGKLWSQRARDVLGDDARLLSHEGPHSSGSNAWAVGGARTASGLPLVGGDPHRVIETPGVYAQVRLACEDPDDPFDVVGFAFPGVPGVQHFAHTGHVAWAITNAMADYQDVYAETLRRVGGPTAPGVEALGPDGWEPVEVGHETIGVAGEDPVDVEVLTTARGPLFDGGPDRGTGLSLRSAPTVVGHEGFSALLPLLRARTVADVDRALDDWVQPVNNVLVADTAGTVRYRVAGRIPVRDERNRRGIVPAGDAAYAWTGWVEDLPRTEVPPEGQVVSANERRGPESGPVGHVFAPPHRAARISALLTGRDDLTTADFAGVHGDTLQPVLGLVQDFLAPLGEAVVGTAGAVVRSAILAWDGRMDASSAGAAAFAAWRAALTVRVAGSEPLRGLGEPPDLSPVLAPWLDLTTRVGLGFETLLRAGRPFGLDLAALAVAALEDAAEGPATWGESHRLSPVHAYDLVGLGHEAPSLPSVALSGDIDCVRCTGSLPGITDESWRGSVARYVWDLADRQAGGWVVPLGASADPRSPHHHDQLPLWADAVLAPIVTDWDLLTEENL